ncbi:MAG TPA: PIN domain-containing protein [bacterium]|nr:PIN domain-containing protein [bacterium]
MLRLIDSTVWIAYLRPRPDAPLVAAVRRALENDEGAIAAPVVAEVLAGIRDPSEHVIREADFKALPHVAVDGDVGYTAARIGRALNAAGRRGNTIDLLLAAGAIHAGAELWSLPERRYEEIRRILMTPDLRRIGALHIRWLA